jgi:hypothetical protein
MSSWYKLAFASLWIFLIGGVAAYGDAPARAKLIDDVTSNLTDGMDLKIIIKMTASNLISRDNRLKLSEKPPFSEKLSDALVKSVNEAEIRDASRGFWEAFSDDELKYLIGLRQSSLGKKIDIIMPDIRKKTIDLVRNQMQKTFEKVTKLPYVEISQQQVQNGSLNKKTTQPSWLTKTIWQFLPETSTCSCEY